MKKLFGLAIVVSLSATSLISPAQALDSNLEIDLVAKSSPDECFVDLGDNQPIAGDDCEQGVPKTNQAYVWGMTIANDKVWFGTGANVQCLVSGTFLQSTGSTVREWGDQLDYVCEMEDGENSQLPASIRDWRAPEMYVQGINSNRPIDLIDLMTPEAQALAGATVGFRAAGAVNDLVYFGGPSLTGGINVFAFDSVRNEFLEAKNLPGYSNIRTLKPFRDSMVAGVSTADGGAVLIFDGGRSNPLDETVALETQAGEIAEFEFHEDRMYFGTWPNLGSGSTTQATVRVGPEIDSSMNFGDHDDYQILWKATDYDPDPVIASTYGIGSMKFFDGELYFGTMHVPFLSLAAITEFYSDELEDLDIGQTEAAALFLGSLRSSALFRYDPQLRAGDDLGEPETLYGNPAMISFGLEEEETFDATLLPNPVSTPPIFGTSGFNNPFNNYIWSMAEYEDKLYIGTMDWSYLLLPPFGQSIDDEQNPLAGPQYFNLSLILEEVFDELALSIAAAEEQTLGGDAESLENAIIVLEDIYDLLAALLSAEIIQDPSTVAEIESILNRIDDLYEDIGYDPDGSFPEDLDLNEEKVAYGLETVQGIFIDLAVLLVEIENEIIELSDQLDPLSYGADVVVFDKNGGPAELLSSDGLGNHLNYGVRTMAAHKSEGVFFGTANPMNLQTEGGWELYNLGPKTFSPFSAPSPFVGPVVTDLGADGLTGDFVAEAGSQLSILGSNLHLVTKVEVAGMRMQPEQASPDSLVISLPAEMSSGLHDVFVYHGSQKILIQERIEISSNFMATDVCSQQGASLWTKRVSEDEAKVYIKCPELGVKYQILAQSNGSGVYEEVFWSRLSDPNDNSQRFAQGARYFVRTLDLDEKLRIRLVEDGEVLNQVVYNK